MPPPPDIFNPSDDAMEAILTTVAALRPMDITWGMATRVANLGNGLAVKYGISRRVRPKEAMAMEYIRSHTTIPIPRVHMCFSRGPNTYIVMDHIEGSVLSKYHEITPESGRYLAAELFQYITQLRNLDTTSHPMGSWPTGPYDNPFFWPGGAPSDEFHHVEQFHEYWLRSVPDSYRGAPITLHSTGEDFPVVLSHGDLTPANIIVKDGKIVAIIDWETFGWYPSFWELVGVLRYACMINHWADDITLAVGGLPEIVRDYLMLVNIIWEA